VNEQRRRLITWVLALVLLVSVGSVGYLAANPELTTTGHTEFYLPTNGTEATSSTAVFSPDSTTEFTVGIANHEHHAVTYRVVVAVNGTELTERAVQIPNSETREVSLPVTVPADPGRYRVEFRLYYDGSTTPELTTWRWIRVRE
jgi:uncharacterized membrane protein